MSFYFRKLLRLKIVRLAVIALVTRAPTMMAAALKHDGVDALYYLVRQGADRQYSWFSGLPQEGPEVWKSLGTIAYWHTFGGLVYKIDPGLWLVAHEAKTVKLEMPEWLLADGIGAVVERFAVDEYRDMPVRGAVVLDAGGFIGDSAVYFTRKGARHVYTVEPFAELCAVLWRNIDINGCSDSVTVLDTALGATEGSVRGMLLRETPMSSTTIDRAGLGSRELHSTGLASLVNRMLEEHPGRDIVGKIDCEGAEYDILLGCDSRSLRSFSYLDIEYHDGVDVLISVLESAGFSCFQKARGERTGHVLARRTW